MKTLGPRFRVRFGCDGEPTYERFSRRDFRLDHRCLGTFFLKKPLPLFDDLLRISMSGYVIDRLVKRRAPGKGWPRRLQMSVEVSEPDFWRASPVHNLLTETLEFVSGDCWQVDFEKAKSGGEASEDSYLDYPDALASDRPLVCLYSGGLDSAMGLVLRTRNFPGRPIIPVTVWHQPGQRALVRRQLRAIKDHCGACVIPLVIKAAMTWNAELRKEETSQRSRSFLFAAVGGVVAALQDVSSVEVFESGIGAINMPLMAGMVGARATRSCHPKFLQLMSRLLTLIAGREIVYRLPFFDKTKGELLKLLAAEGTAELVHSTVSCVHYPLRERPHKQCGVCPACIFRRQAMFVAGIRELRGIYKFDIFGPPRLVNRIPDRLLKYLKASLMQVGFLAPLEHQNELPRRFRRHLLGSGIINDGESYLPIIDLLRRFRQEWLNIAADGTERGLAWARLFAPNEAIKQEGMSHASA